MKRLAIGLTVAAVMLVPGSATAARSTYKGTIDTDPATVVKFTLKSRDGKKKVANPSVKRVLAYCRDEGTDENPHQRPIDVTGRGSVPVKRKKFTWRATEPFVSTMKFKGKLGRGGKASGTFQFFGEVNTDEGLKYCDTRIVPWSASKG